MLALHVTGKPNKKNSSYRTSSGKTSHLNNSDKHPSHTKYKNKSSFADHFVFTLGYVYVHYHTKWHVGSSHCCVSSAQCKFKHIIYFNSTLFWGKESVSLCGRRRNYQSLSMNDRCMRCLGRQPTRVAFVVLRPVIWRFLTPACLVGVFIAAQCVLCRANYLASDLHSRLLADDGHGCGGGQSLDPSWCGTMYSVGSAAGILLPLSVVAGGRN